MSKNDSTQFKIFLECNSRELYHYLHSTLKNAHLGDPVIRVGTTETHEVTATSRKYEKNCSKMYLIWYRKCVYF